MEDKTMKTQEMDKKEKFERTNQLNEEDRYMHDNSCIWYN